MKKIGEHTFVKGLQSFFRSEWYMALITFLMVCANLFALELAVFYCYLLLGLLAVLFDTDLKAVIPIGCCSYMTISYDNNPAMNPTGSAFYEPDFKFQLTLICCVAGVMLIGRCLARVIGGERKKAPTLTLGFAALGLALVLGGVMTKFYDARTAFFGFAVTASLCVLYFLFYYGVNWNELKKDYFAKLFFIVGIGVAAELAGVYLRTGILKNPELDRGVLITGWGMYNNVGCVLSMCMPSALYLSLKEERGFIYTALGILLFGALVFTQSRGSILFGGIVYLVGLLIVLIKCDKRARRQHLWVLGAAILIFFIFALIFRKELAVLFQDAIKKTFSADPSNARGPIYAEGIEHFASEPFFGVGFYQCTAFRWGSLSSGAFLPPRYHNTIIQLLASGGLFALGCYIYHRAETLILLFRRPTIEKTFLALSIASLLLTSLVECHLFSFGPAILYSILLAFAEGQDVSSNEHLNPAFES